MADGVSLVLMLAGTGLAGIGAGFLLGRRAQAEVPAPAAKFTTAWRLSELADPVLVARDVEDVPTPRGMPVYASGLVAPEVQARCEVHETPAGAAEFAWDREAERAIVFLGGVRSGSLAMLSDDPALVGRLRAEYHRLHDRRSDYVERASLGSLGTRIGVVVETEGYVQDVLPWRDRFMIRLQDRDEVLGVVVAKDPEELRDRRVRVRGRLEKDDRGYVVLQASELRTIG